MQGLAVVVGLVAIGYGFVAGGILGALTGLVASVDTGSGLAIARAEGGTGVEAAGGFMRTAQRVGGVLSAVGCLAGAYFGGWRWGWGWAIAGYLLGAAVGLLLYTVTRKSQATK